MARVKIVLAILAILIISGLLIYVQTLRASNKNLAGDLQQSQAEVIVLRASLTANAVALRVREAEVAELSRKTNEILEGLDDLYKTDEVASVWADTELPESVLRLLR